MKSKFKIGDKVIVNGIGKNENQIYRNRKGSIIERDAYFFDYNVRFSNGKNDWFDAKALRKIKKYRERKIKNETS